MTLQVRTVLGDIDPSELGRTDYHEHLFQSSVLLPGDELDDEQLSQAEATSLREAGMDAMVDATPVGLGRDPAALARVSAASGLTVVATTGLHREAHYPHGHWAHQVDESEWTDRFVAELTEGQRTTDGPGATDLALTPSGAPVRAGLLKAGISYWSWSPFERRALAAVAQAHRATGAPVMIHLEHGSAALDVLDLLENDGVSPDRVVLAHVDRNPDAELLVELAQRGAYLGCDGMARHRDWPDSAIVELIARVVGAGAAERVVLGGDVARRTRYHAYGGLPGLKYFPERFLPRVERATSQQATHMMLVDNPARLLAWA